MTKKNPAAVALGTLGGKSKSTAKQLASQKNGKFGGRHKKNCTCPRHTPLIISKKLM